MNRTIAAVVLALSTVPALAFAQVEDDLDTDAVVSDEEGLDEELDDEESFDDEEWDGEDFCGGGDESIVDVAYYELEAGNYAEARRILVAALREGEVERWQRGHALATLAEAQLNLGEYRGAVLNYRKALREDAEGVGAASRVGLATALYLLGARSQARDEAMAARDAVCADRYAMVACYGAHAVLAQTGSSEDREAARQALSELREGHAELEEQLDEIERRIGRRERATDRA